MHKAYRVLIAENDLVDTDEHLINRLYIRHKIGEFNELEV
jgi:hypothetical protein